MTFSNVSKFFCNFSYIHELIPKLQNASGNETLNQNKISILACITEREYQPQGKGWRLESLQCAVAFACIHYHKPTERPAFASGHSPP